MISGARSCGAFALALAAGLSFSAASGSQAAVFTFDVVFDSGPLNGQTFIGTVEVNDGDFTRSGSERFAPAGSTHPGVTGELLNLFIEIDGNPFEMTEDEQFPDYPQALFNNGALVGVDFVVLDIPELSITWGFFDANEVRYGVAGAFSTGFVAASAEIAVPAPAAFGLFGLGLLGSAWAVRRARGKREGGGRSSAIT